MALATAMVSGNRQSRWVGQEFLPMALAAVVPVLCNYGVIESSFLTQYALMIGSTVAPTMLFYSLYQRLLRSCPPNICAQSPQTIDPLASCIHRRCWSPACGWLWQTLCGTSSPLRS